MVHGSTPLRAETPGGLCSPASTALEHTQIPELRAIVQVRLPIAGTSEEVALPSQPATVDALLHAGWRPDLVLQMPRERDQPALAELSVSLQQPQTIRPPSVSPLLADENPSNSLKHHFLIVRMPRPTSYQELQTCLRRTLVAEPAESEPGSGPASPATPPAPSA